MRFFLAKEIIAKMPNLTGVLDGLPEHDVELLRLMRTAAEWERAPFGDEYEAAVLATKLLAWSNFYTFF